jgi:hypothetical protein
LFGPASKVSKPKIQQSLEDPHWAKENSMTLLSTLLGKKTRPTNSTTRRTTRLSLEQFDERLVPSTVATGADGTAYAIIGSDRELWAHTPSGNWSYCLNNVTQVSCSPGDYKGGYYVDALTTNDVVWQSYAHETPFQSILLGNGNISAMGAGSGNSVFVAWGSSKELWYYGPGYGWLDMHTSNVSQIGDFGSAIVYGNGALGVWGYGGHSGSYGVAVSSGVHEVANSWHGAYETLFTYGSDNELWGIDGDKNWSFTYYGNNVAQVSCDMAGDINYVSTNGNLMHTGNYYQYIYSGAWTY